MDALFENLAAFSFILEGVIVRNGPGVLNTEDGIEIEAFAGAMDIGAGGRLDGAEFTKNRKDARQPITRDLAKRLADLAQEKQDDALLLDIPTSQAWRMFKDDLKAAKIPTETSEGKATWHCLRKSYVNALIHSGADVKTVMELARHSCASLTMEVYASADKARLRQAAEATPRHIEDTLASSPCCSYVAHEENGKKREVVRKAPSKTYVGSKMVGATGFEPATPRPPV